MKNFPCFVSLLTIFIGKVHSVLSGCTNDSSTDFQLTASGYHVESNISCVSVCNSYNPPVFIYAFFLEGQLCFCRNGSLPPLNISNFNSLCIRNTCLSDTAANCFLSNYEVLPLTLGIVEWNITFYPPILLVDNEVQIKTNILKGDASSAFVRPVPNKFLSDVQTVNQMTMKKHFYLPGLQQWSQEVGNNFTNPFVTTTWLQVDEKVGGIFVIPSMVSIDGFYNFLLVITQGTNMNVTLSLPKNKTLFFNADVIHLTYGLDIPLIYTSSGQTCSLSRGFILKQVVLTSGYFTKVKLKVSAVGVLEIAILRPICTNFTIFCSFTMECAKNCFLMNLLEDEVVVLNPSIITALVVTKFLFLLNVTGIIEIPIQNKNNEIQENDMIWIGGNASLFCNGVINEKVQVAEAGKTMTFSTNCITNNDFFISLLISNSFEYFIPTQSYTTSLFNFRVDASNHIPSFQQLNYSFKFQVPVSGLRFAEQLPVSKFVAGYKPNTLVTLKAEIDSGSDVTYTFSIPKINYFRNASNENQFSHAFTNLGVYSVFLTAANTLNSINTSIDISILSEVSRIYLYVEKNQLQDREFNATIQIFNGSNVDLTVDFGDSSPVINITSIDATPVNGFVFTVAHKYSVCNNFTINASARYIFANSLGILNTAIFFNSTDLTVFCPLSRLNVITTPNVSLNGYVYLHLSKSLILNINQNSGSFILYKVVWGDSTYEIKNQTMNWNPVLFQVEHMYYKEGKYTVNVTSHNLLQTSYTLIKVEVRYCSAPEVSFFYGTISSPVSIIRSVGANITAVVENISKVCPLENYSFEWNLAGAVSTSTVTFGFLSPQKVTYTIAKNSLDIGLYKLSLQYNYGDVSNVYVAYLNVTFSPLYMEIDNGFFASIKYKRNNRYGISYQNFTISAKSSFDPDDPIAGIINITFNWKCKVASNFSVAQEVMERYKTLNLNFSSDTCFNQNWISISSFTSEVTFSTQQFLEGISYHIEVCGTKYAGNNLDSVHVNKTGCFSQQLEIISGDLPTIFARCMSNCDSKLNFMEPVIYSYVCEDCGSQKLIAEWRITDDTGNVPSEVMSKGATLTGFLTPSLVINKDILLESKNYTFTLDVGFADSLKHVIFKFTKATCSRPSSGVCYIYPTEGFALETIFKLLCKDWRDSDGFLSYKFSYDDNPSQRLRYSSSSKVDYPRINIASTEQPSLINFIMGPGYENNDYNISIIIEVCGKYNAYTKYKLWIKVHPSNKPINLQELVMGVSFNDVQVITNIVQAVSSTINKIEPSYYKNNGSPLNELEDTGNGGQESHSHLRTKMIDLLSKTPINNLYFFKSISDTLTLLSHKPKELVPQSQNQAADIVKKLGDLLTKENLRVVGPKKFETLTQPFVNSISKLFEANTPDTSSDEILSTTQTTTSTSSSNAEENENVGSRLFKCLDIYFMTLLSYKVPGESATTQETKQFSFILKKDYVSSLSNTSIGSSEGGFILPDSKDMFNDSIANAEILIQNVRMKDNAYTWDSNRSQNILSETQSLSFSDSNGRPIKVSNSLQPINIAIQNIPEKMSGKNISLSMPNDIYQVKLPFLSDCNLLLNFVFKNDLNNLTNLIVYIQYGKVTTKLDFDIMLNISTNYGVVMTKNNISVFNAIVNNTTHEHRKNISSVLLRNQNARLLDDGTLILWNFSNSTYSFLNKSELHLSFSYEGPIPDEKLDLNTYTFDAAESFGTFDYEMKSFCAECNYWNEDSNKWMSDGCQFDVETSTFLVTKCKCNHLTAFGGFFVAPNPIPTPSLAMLKHGYVLLVTVGVIILLWILGLIFARKMDNKDISKVGVCPLLDNQIGESYLYQIIVNTGSQRNAGTKSNIFLTVFGENSDSGVRRLKDSERQCFQRSSCDVFIMTTQSSFGDIDFIRLWHDNSGGGWYLNNIIITDLQTDKQFLFIGHRWIAVDRGLCTLDCVIPTASAEETSDFKYIFTTKTSHDLSDKHLWFSIFARPPKSNFTRCQRLSVAVSLLMTSMMASTLFYGRIPPADPSVENKIGSFSFTWTQVYVALISTCITIPVNIVLVQLFRTIKPFENIIKENSNEVQHWNEADELQEKNSCSSEFINSNNEKTTTILIEKDKPSLLKEEKKKYLPPWCLYIAWFICVSSIFGCGFIILLNGMAFGNRKSLNWLSSVSIGFVKDIFFIQPIKIFFLSIFVALIVKKIEEESCEVEIQGKMLAHDESWLHKPKNKATIFDRVDIEFKPPDCTTILKMREMGFKNMKMYSIIQEIVLYFFYAILVFFIGYMTREDFAFYQTRNVEELFNLRLRHGVSYPDGTVFNQIQSSKDFWPWMEKLFLPQIYPDPWYNLSAFYGNSETKNFPGKLFLNDLNSKIVNGIRIRQVRVLPNSCIKAESIVGYLELDCLSPYKSIVEEKRDFYFNWSLPIKYKSAINPSTMPWRYQTWKDLDGYPYAADLNTYYGGGYVIEFFPKWKNQYTLDKAKNHKWIDRQTRAIIIEFALFNPATNYFSMVTMVLEFLASGGVLPDFSVHTFKLYSSTKGTGVAMLGSQILFIIMMLLFSIRECRFLYRTGWRYFLEFWNLVEVALILLSVVAVGFFFYKNHLAKVLLQRMPAKKPQSFINFQFASYWDLTYLYIVSLIVFFVTLKFIKLLRFNRRVSMLSSTLKAAWYPLSMFGIIFLIVLCSVISSASIVFGMLLEGYQNYFKTIASIISLLLGKFSYSQFENANSVLGPVFFFGFNVMVNWIIMNMFLSILNDVFAVVCTNIEYQNNDYEMVDFVMEHFKDWFGWHSSKETELKLAIDTKVFDADKNNLLPVHYKEKSNYRKNKVKVNFNKVNNKRYFDLKILLDEKLSKLRDYLEENELDIKADETLYKFINCINLLSFDGTEEVNLNEPVTMEVKN
ncbi:polycystin-1-like protein 2 isoform X1 [Hydra vulgaris]|uniref:polycystin-1-like protein 2 isoform X1 n=1 Tax=Hydra vulgaris TaxID=6087 RepID=UPI0032EA5D4F